MTKSQHTTREGAIGVVNQGNEFLVIRRSATVRAPHKLCFPGGGIEPGESQQDALVRELNEEISVTARPVRWLWSSYSASGVRLHWWLAEYDGSQVPVANPDEVADLYWMTADVMLDHPQLLETNRRFLHALQRGEFQLKSD